MTAKEVYLSIINDKIIRVSVTHEITIFKNGTAYSYLVETTKNNEILCININHSYLLRHSTRRAFMDLIRSHFLKPN